MDLSPDQAWFIAGLLCLILEFVKLPGIGLLFLGFGALTTAVLINIYSQLLASQFTIFGLASFTWFIVLWHPLKKWLRSKNKNQEYIDIIGSEVEANTLLEPGKLGQVKWSGTIMNATLDKHETQTAQPGEKLKIKAVHGNTLICTKISNPNQKL